MSLRIDMVTHAAAYLINEDREYINDACCDLHQPCGEHRVKLLWLVRTVCGLSVVCRGRPKKKHVNCIACIAGAP